MRAIGSYILIKPIEEQIKSQGIIITGDEAKTLRYKKAKVIKVGNEVSAVKEGDEIYYDRAAGNQLILQDTYCLVIRERDVVVSISHD